MIRPPKIIDRVTIERATGDAVYRCESMERTAEKMKKDPDKNKRMEKQQCVVCFYITRVHLNAFYQSKCGICDSKILSSNSDVGVLCKTCAVENELCLTCGADIDLKRKRKPRPYEAKK